MKKVLIVGGVTVVVLAVVGGLILYNLRARSPEVLLRRLAAGRGDREGLIMQLNLCRGDVVPTYLDALKWEETSADFRATVLDLLFKKNRRSPDERIEEVILRSLADPDTTVRRAAARGIATYGSDDLQIALAGRVTDPDPETRRQAYLVLGGPADWHDPAGGLWGQMSDEQRDKVIRDCLAQFGSEQDPKMRLLARAVLGREIAIRAREAMRAVQTSDVLGAEKILREALQLDPANHQARIHLVRHDYKNVDKGKALELAREHGALMEIPQLSRGAEIDGDPTDEVWKEAFTTDEFYKSTSRWVPMRIEGRSRAHAGHRDGKIYIAILGYEENLSLLISEHTARDSEVFLDDCAEMIFDPDVTGNRMFQFVVNSVGVLFDQADRDNKKNFPCEYKVRIFPDRGYWACEFAVDGKELGNHPIQPGDVWALVLFRARLGPASEHGGTWPLFGGAMRMDLYPLAIFK